MRLFALLFGGTFAIASVVVAQTPTPVDACESVPVYRGIPIRNTNKDPNEQEKIYLLLGDGESLQSDSYSAKKYHFELDWGDWSRRYIANSYQAIPAHSDHPPKTHRPVWKFNGQVLICRFEFPLIQVNRSDDEETAPTVSSPDPLVMDSMLLDVSVNGKKEGFTVHGSHDAISWFTLERESFKRFFPCRTFYLRFSAKKIEHFRMNVTTELVFAREMTEEEMEKWAYTDEDTGLILPIDTVENMLSGIPGRRAGQTFFAKKLPGTDESPLQFLDAFLDESDTFCMIWKNKQSEAVKPWFGDLRGFGSDKELYSSTCCFFPPSLPAESVCAIYGPQLNKPGRHLLTIGTEHERIQCSINIDAPQLKTPVEIRFALFGKDTAYLQHRMDGEIFEDVFTETVDR